jgi:dipeptidyl aminopeptidase/acylaminoacyl peptidase
MATRKPVMSIARAVSIAVLSLLSIAIVPASSRTVLGASAEDPGTIAYVRRSPNQIRLIQPDGTNDHSLWTSPTPDSVVGITNLAWRPDGAMLAFSSDHEDTCSWYETDVYTIRSNGAGLRRVTNSPACADLSSYPQGAVIVNVASLGKTGHFSVYVQGSAELKGITLAGMDSGQVTFDHVADLGPHIVQPAVGIYGLYRYPGDTAPDVQAGQTVAGPTIWLSSNNEHDALGTGKITWRSDGSRIGYAMRSCSAARQIAPNPPLGSLGADLPTGADLSPCLVDWAPTASRADQFLYSVDWSAWVDNVQGIYLTSTTATGAGTQLVSEGYFQAHFNFNNIGRVYDLKWLPDGSGFLFTMGYIYVNLDDPDPVCVGTCSDVFEYSFATGAVTQVTRLGDDTARGLSISPDGQHVAFERVTEDPINPLNNTSAIWVVQRDGSGLRLLVNDAASPAWGGTTPSLREVRLPLVIH